jgi:hypothetical protein
MAPLMQPFAWAGIIAVEKASASAANPRIVLISNTFLSLAASSSTAMFFGIELKQLKWPLGFTRPDGLAGLIFDENRQQRPAPEPRPSRAELLEIADRRRPPMPLMPLPPATADSADTTAAMEIDANLFPVTC